MKNVGCQRADRHIPQARSGKVPLTILLLLRPSFVERPAVALDDEPTVNDEIDTANTHDEHLSLVGDAQCAEDEPNERLRARLRGRIDEAEKSPEASRQLQEHRLQLRHGDESVMHEAVERRHCCTW